MSLIDRLKALLTPQDAGDDDRPTTFVYVYLPEALEPDEREARYGGPLDAELQVTRAGYVSGGGSLLDEEDEAGDRRVIFSGIDVDAFDLELARTILRDHLPELGCPAGTRLEWRDDAGEWEDEYTGSAWRCRRPLTPYEERGDHG